jgi:hypothetical protein
VHRVHHRDVGELEDRLVAEVRVHGLEHGVVDATEAEHERVGVREQRAFEWREQVRHRPRLDCLDLLLGEAERAARLAVLREHELAADEPAGPGLPELAQRGLDLAVRARVETEAATRVLQHVG